MHELTCSCRTRPKNPNRINPNTVKRRCHNPVWLRLPFLPLGLLSVLALLLNHAAHARDTRDGKPALCQSTTTHSKSKAKGGQGAAKRATASKKAKAEAIERKIQAEIAAQPDDPIATQISPQSNFVLRINDAGDIITFFRTSDGKAVSRLVIPKDMDESAIGRVDVSDDERFIIVFFPVAHNRNECLLYERVRPFIYHFSKFCPDGSLNNAIGKQGRDSDIVGIQWAGGSRYLLIPTYDKDLDNQYSTTKFDTRTGRVTVLHKKTSRIK